MKTLRWLFNPFALYQEPTWFMRWLMQRGFVRIMLFLWTLGMFGGLGLFQAGISLACEQLPTLCVPQKPDTLMIWLWGGVIWAIGWIFMSVFAWLCFPTAHPLPIRRWFATPFMMALLFALPNQGFAWSGGKCDWNAPAPCFENQLINLPVLLNVALWNMLNRPLLLFARWIERWREVLVENLFRDIIDGVSSGVWQLFWISVGFAILFYIMSFAISLFFEWNVVNLQHLIKTVILAWVFFSGGGVLLNTLENMRILIGQGLQTVTSDVFVGSASNIMNVVKISEEDGGRSLPPKSIYDTNSCGADVPIQRAIPAIMTSDIAARFLRADAVDIHCPIRDPYQIWNVAVPAHLGPGPATGKWDSYPPSSTGAYPSSPSPEEAFLFRYLEPNLQSHIYDGESSAILASERQEMFTKGMDGVYLQVQAIPLGLMAIAEQTLYLMFALCLFLVWLSLIFSFIFEPFVAMSGMVSNQLSSLMNVVKSSWVAAIMIGIIMGLMRMAADSGSTLLVLGAGVIGVFSIIGLCLSALELVGRTVRSMGSTLGEAPRVTGRSFRSIGLGTKSVVQASVGGMTAYRKTGDARYAGGVAAGSIRPLRQISNTLMSARAALRPNSDPTKSRYGMGLNVAKDGQPPTSWYTQKRMNADRQKLNQLRTEQALTQAGERVREQSPTAQSQQQQLQAFQNPQQSLKAGQQRAFREQKAGMLQPAALQPLEAGRTVVTDRSWGGHFTSHGWTVQPYADDAQKITAHQPQTASIKRDMRTRQAVLRNVPYTVYQAPTPPATPPIAPPATPPTTPPATPPIAPPATPPIAPPRGTASQQPRRVHPAMIPANAQIWQQIRDHYQGVAPVADVKQLWDQVHANARAARGQSPSSTASGASVAARTERSQRRAGDGLVVPSPVPTKVQQHHVDGGSSAAALSPVAPLTGNRGARRVSPRKADDNAVAQTQHSTSRSLQRIRPSADLLRRTRYAEKQQAISPEDSVPRGAVLPRIAVRSRMHPTSPEVRSQAMRRLHQNAQKQQQAPRSDSQALQAPIAHVSIENSHPTRQSAATRQVAPLSQRAVQQRIGSSSRANRSIQVQQRQEPPSVVKRDLTSLQGRQGQSLPSDQHRRSQSIQQGALKHQPIGRKVIAVTQRSQHGRMPQTVGQSPLPTTAVQPQGQRISPLARQSVRTTRLPHARTRIQPVVKRPLSKDL